jgi:hypothetical protein
MYASAAALARLKEICVYIRLPAGSAGSGYLIAHGHIGTAQHVVDKLAMHEKVDVEIGIGELLHKCTATMLRADPATDAAVLVIDKPFDRDPMPLSQHGCELHATWSAFGFPGVAQRLANDKVPHTGVKISGHVEDPSTTNDRGELAIQLFSNSFAAGTATPIHGFSGSPVMIGGALVGHLTKGLPDRDDTARIAFGFGYACPISAVVALLPEGVEPLFAPPASPLPPHWRALLAEFHAHYRTRENAPVAFCGREPEMAELMRWVADPGSASRCLVTGPMGRGKSALLSCVALAAEELGGGDHDLAWEIVFVPISIRFETNAPLTYLQILSTWLTHLAHTAPQSETGIKSRLEYESDCAAAIEHIASSGRRLLIIIDGIDEALNDEFSATWFRRARTGSIKLLLSARDQLGREDANAWLARLQWPADAKCLPLPLLGADGVASVIAAAGAAPEQCAANSPLVGRLLYLSGGEPFLLWLYTRDIWPAGRESPVDIAELNNREPGFQDYFLTWLNLQNRAWQNEHQAGAAIELTRIKAYLAVLACAHGRLTAADLKGLVARAPGIAPAGLRTEDILWPARRFVVGGARGSDASTRGYVLAHPILAEFFTGYFDPDDIAETRRAFVAWGMEAVATLNNDNAATEEANPYQLEFLSSHLNDAGASAADYALLLTPGWRAAHVAFDGNLTGFIREIRTATEAVLLRRPPAWRSELFCRNLMLSSALAVAAIPTKLMMAGIKHKLTRPGAALRALESADHNLRWQGLLRLAKHLSPEQRPNVIQEALRSAGLVAGGRDRAIALASILPELAPGFRSSIQNQVFDEFGHMGNMAYFLDAVDGVATHVDAEGRSMLIDYVLGSVKYERDWYYLLHLLPHLDDSERETCIVMAAMHHRLMPAPESPDHEADTEFFPGLHGNLLAVAYRFLPTEWLPILREPALQAARCSDDQLIKAIGLVGVVAHSPHTEIELMHEAIAVIDKLDTLHLYIWGTGDLARNLTESSRRAAIIAPALARACEDIQQQTFSRFDGIADVLDRDGRQTALTAIATAWPRGKAAALNDLADYLDEDQAVAALVMFEQIRDERVCDYALAALDAAEMNAPGTIPVPPPALPQDEIDQVAEWMSGPLSEIQYGDICERLARLPLLLRERAYERVARDAALFDRSFVIHCMAKCAEAIRQIDEHQGLQTVRIGIIAARSTFP